MTLVVYPVKLVSAELKPKGRYANDLNKAKVQRLKGSGSAMKV